MTLRHVAGAALVILCLSVGLLWAFYAIMKRATPVYSKDIRLSPSLLQSPVFIDFDDHVHPTITATTEQELFFAMGYAHARERFWQMEFRRKTAEGRLSEIIDDSWVPVDRLFRTLGLAVLCDSLWQSPQFLSDTSRRVLSDYTRGVNAFLSAAKSGQELLPIEFELLHYEPEEWKETHSLALMRLNAWELSHHWRVDLAFANLASRVGLSRALILHPSDSKTPFAIIDSFASPHSAFSDSLQKLNRKDRSRQPPSLPTTMGFKADNDLYRHRMGISSAHIGSNAWAISPKRTPHGTALLAADPHHSFSLPSRWMEVTLECTPMGIFASGLSLPGIPCIVMGRNHAIAWASTLLKADDADFFIHLDSAQSDVRVTRQERIEEIKVRSRTSLPHTVIRTDLGPLIRDEVYLHPAERPSELLTNYDVSLQWTGFFPDDDLAPYLKLLHASSWSSFNAAISGHCVPALNFLYADTAGNIGYHAAGKLPIRVNHDGLKLRTTRRKSELWEKFIPFSDLPSVFNPPSGHIISANQPPVRKFYPFYLSTFWDDDSRAARAHTLIGTDTSLTLQTLHRFQSDVISPYAQQLQKMMVELLRQDSSITSHIGFRYFENWDGGFDALSIGATLFTEFLHTLYALFFQDSFGEVFEEFTEATSGHLYLTKRVINELLADTTAHPSPLLSEWVYRQSMPNREAALTALRRAFVNSLRYLEYRFGNEASSWQWGKRLSLTAPHLLSNLETQRILNRNVEDLFTISITAPFGHPTAISSGDYILFHHDSSVFRAEKRLPFLRMYSGSTARFIVDLIPHAPAQSSVIFGGNSGHPLNKYYRDQAAIWPSSSPRMIYDSTQRSSQSKGERIRLVPSRE